MNRKLNVLLVFMQKNLASIGVRYIYYSVMRAGHKPILLYPNLNRKIENKEKRDHFLTALGEFSKYKTEISMLHKNSSDTCDQAARCEIVQRSIASSQIGKKNPGFS